MLIILQKIFMNTFRYCFINDNKEYPAILKLNSITKKLTIKNGKKSEC